MKNDNVSLSQAHETGLTLRKAGATVQNFWQPLAQSERLAKKVIAFIEEQLRFVFTLTWEYDRDMKDFRRLYSCVMPGAKFEPRLEELVFPPEKSISGECLVQYAKHKGVHTGLWHAEAMLRDSQEINPEWRKLTLIFPEQWVSLSDDNVYLWTLYWWMDSWNLSLKRIDGVFTENYRLVAYRMPKQD